MNLHRQSPWPASVAHHDSSSLQTTGNWTDKATYLWAVWPWPGLLPGLLGPPLLLPEALSMATAGSRWPLVASAALLHFHSEAGTLIPGWQLSCRQQEGSLESQPCKMKTMKLKMRVKMRGAWLAQSLSICLQLRMRGARLMGALLTLAGLLRVALFLKIAAFNIRTFGETKMSNATLSHYIVQILSRYDIVVIQEVRDSHLTAMGKLLDILNRDDPNTYQFVVSEPLGRNSYKEQYLFLFRPNQVSVLDSYQYDDGCEPCGNDTFSREPTIVLFHSPFTAVQAFAIIPLHAAPLDAVAEMDSLYDVYLDVRQKWDLELRGPLPVGLHPPAHEPGLPVADS
ncbi:deoxyribonuclease-1 isoform X3 [Mirounga angustirostris]|uniref:deoxyribonuclease-1 isoform X3 n=1 Tax=Mirounga leonina TaxID=9715 RepID=UPI00156C5229|nr:deoxyribonuclease-1 isoform X3 [Mirounga leonina]XP_034878004.1 deoxyribonuclease-1 isoform X3 [Mirounga leonina]